MRIMMMMMMRMTMTVTVMTMMMVMMMIMDHIYIYILKVHRHGISKVRNPSAIPARSNVRVAPHMFTINPRLHQVICTNLAIVGGPTCVDPN